MAKYLRPTLKRYINDMKMGLYEGISELQYKQTFADLTDSEKERLIAYRAQLHILKDIEEMCSDLNSN